MALWLVLLYGMYYCNRRLPVPLLLPPFFLRLRTAICYGSTLCVKMICETDNEEDMKKK